MTHDKVVEYYDNIASKYDSDRFGNTYGKFIDRQERKILDRLGLKSGGNVLEIACGTGRLLDYATAGLDASAEMLAVARGKFPEKELVQSPAQETPFADESFDAVYSFHLMMHLPTDTISRIMAEAHRILKPGGRLIFDIPSLGRRSLLKKQQPTWHGRTSLDRENVERLAAGLFDIRSCHGVMMMPVHKLPSRLRLPLLGLDTLLTRSPLRPLSSYLVFELVKKKVDKWLTGAVVP